MPSLTQTPAEPTAQTGLTPAETRDVLTLSSVLLLRLLGLFLLLPVLSLYAVTLKGATPFLAGIAVGAYGLSQGLLQIPAAMLSDRWGRKPVIMAGLLLYALGCILAARASTMWVLIAARLLQGSGAIAAVLLATIADVTREEVRTRAMAFTGMAVGASVAVGFAFGPLVAGLWGVRGIFWLIAFFDLAAISYVHFFIVEPTARKKTDFDVRHVAAVWRDRNLGSLSAQVFLLHVGMTSVFVAAPFLLASYFETRGVWKVYIPMLVIGGALMLRAAFWAEAHKKVQELLFAGIFAAGAGYLLLAGCRGREATLIAGLMIYFIGFLLIEPALPALVSRFAPVSFRGTALGAFNMSQYLGAFVGSSLGGFFVGHDLFWLFPFLLLLCMPWFIAASRLDDPDAIREERYRAKSNEPRHAEELARIPGVYDARWLPSGELEVRYSAKKIDPQHLLSYLKNKGLL